MLEQVDEGVLLQLENAEHLVGADDGQPSDGMSLYFGQAGHGWVQRGRCGWVEGFG